MDQESAMSHKTHINGSPRPFNLVNTNLLQMGCIALDKFLSSKSDADFEDVHGIEVKPTVAQTPLPLLESSALKNQQPSSNPADANLVEHQSAGAKMQNVARLYRACQGTFGNPDALKFDFTQDDGSQSKQCILTITRPGGSVRAYKTDPVFARKTDAKAHVANIAVEMGALEFITAGDSDALKQRKGLLLSPLDVANPEPQEREEVVVEPSPPGGPVELIENCCIEWRAGTVKPFWVAYQDQSGKCFGAALRIRLTPHSSRVYTTDTVFESAPDAKIGCANTALQEGVLDYIKHGNGQTDPAEPTVPTDGLVPELLENPTSVISLQAFYETLPQPFPEPVADKTASEINAPAWLNTLVQSARGAKLKCKFMWMMGTQGLHGCVLRLERLNAQCKSYLVDPRFHRRADAKAAACLLAMSQGIGDYIRRAGSEVENKVSEYAKKLVNQTIYTGINTECLKIRPNGHPEYTFIADGDAFGCTLTVDISPSPEKSDLRSFTTKSEYRNKADAKVAVAILAAEQGIFELLRFRGAPPPPGYVTFWESHDRNPVSNPVSKKRKEPDTRDGGDPDGQKMKKPKLELVDSQYDLASGSKGIGKKPPASGSSGLVSLGVPAQKAGRSSGQHQHGHRGVGHSRIPHNPSQFGAMSSSFSHPSLPGVQPGLGMAPTMHYMYQFPPQHIYGASQPLPGGNQYAGATPYPQMVPRNAPFYPGYVQYGTVPPTIPYNPHPHQYQQYQFAAPGGQPYSNHSNLPGPSTLGLPMGGDHPDHSKSMDTSLDYGNGSDQDSSHRKRAKKSKGKAKRDKVEAAAKKERLSAPATDAETASSGGRSLTAESGQTQVKSYFDTLKEFCVQEKKPHPHFYREAIFGETGTRYKVWIEMGSERLELQTTFESMNDGRERLSRQVLNRLRNTGRKPVM